MQQNIHIRHIRGDNIDEEKMRLAWIAVDEWEKRGKKSYYNQTFSKDGLNGGPVTVEIMLMAPVGGTQDVVVQIYD